MRMGAEYVWPEKPVNHWKLSLFGPVIGFVALIIQPMLNKSGHAVLEN
jgi:hypothetical protein